MSRRSEPQPWWEFQFCIESPSGRPISSEVPDELLMAILKLVEDRGLQMGGGYGPPTEEDLEIRPHLYPVEDLPTDGEEE